MSPSRTVCDRATRFLDKIDEQIADRDKFKGEFACLVGDEEAFRLCVSRIESLYEAKPQAKDGLSKLAFLFHLCGDSSTALKLWTRDISAGRISWWQQGRYAELLGELHGIDTAIKYAESVYERNPEAKNIISSIGFNVKELSQEQRTACFQREIELGRMTPGFMLNFACHLAGQGLVDEAPSMVGQAYLADAGLMDGYARVGWILNSLEGYTHTALNLFSKDLESGRLSQEWMQNLQTLRLEAKNMMDAHQAEIKLQEANAVPVASDWELILERLKSRILKGDKIDAADAEREIEGSANPPPNYRSLIAAELFAIRSDWNNASALYSFDHKAGTLSPAKLIDYAACLLWAGREEAAIGVVEEAYAKDPFLYGGFSRLAKEELARGATLSDDPHDWTVKDHLLRAASKFQMDCDRARYETNMMFEHANCLMRCASTLVSKDYWEKAKQMMMRVRELNPALPDRCSCNPTPSPKFKGPELRDARTLTELISGISEPEAILAMAEGMA